jgi:ribosomal protein S27AE
MKALRGTKACPRCGSWELRIPGSADGVVVGQGQDLSLSACDRCGLVAVPLEFPSERARLAFEQEQARHPAKDWPQAGAVDLRRRRDG